MARHPARPEVGRIVEVMRGRERGLFAVVVGHDADRFVYLADGGKRSADQPKKKNALHVRATSRRVSDFMESDADGRKLTNAELRYVLTQYQKTNEPVKGLEQGGELSGER